METVGIRELKQNLSKYIKKTKQGEKIIITEHKKEVAILLPFAREEDENEKLIGLAREGIVNWRGGKPKGSITKPTTIGQSVSATVLENRR